MLQAPTKHYNRTDQMETGTCIKAAAAATGCNHLSDEQMPVTLPLQATNQSMQPAACLRLNRSVRLTESASAILGGMPQTMLSKLLQAAQLAQSHGSRP